MSGLLTSPQQGFTTPTLPPYLQNYLQSAATWLTGQLGTAPAYTGPLAAGLSPQTNQALTDIQAQEQYGQALPQTGVPTVASYASGAQNPYAAANANTAVPTLQSYAAGNETNPYLNTLSTTIGAMTDQQLQQEIQRANQQLAAMGLGNSSPLLNTQAQIYGQALPAETAELNNVLSSGMQAEQANQIGAANTIGQGNIAEQGTQLGAANTALNYPSSLTSALFQMGQYPTQVSQNADTLAYQQFLNQFQELYQPIQSGSGISGLASLQAPQPTTYGAPPIVGLATGAADLFGASGGGK